MCFYVYVLCFQHRHPFHWNLWGNNCWVRGRRITDAENSGADGPFTMIPEYEPTTKNRKYDHGMLWTYNYLKAPKRTGNKQTTPSKRQTNNNHRYYPFGTYSSPMNKSWPTVLSEGPLLKKGIIHYSVFIAVWVAHYKDPIPWCCCIIGVIIMIAVWDKWYAIHMDTLW